jgi:hypothetical protein
MYSYGYHYPSKAKRISEGQLIFDDYKARVQADGGVVENRDCVIRNLNKLI